MYKISKELQDIQGTVSISGSKSESNRLILLRAYTSYFKIFNLSDSDDTQLMLSAIESDKKEINIGHAGTAMGFFVFILFIHLKKFKNFDWIKKNEAKTYFYFNRCLERLRL